ncbi:MAG TPA: YicC/YloC family endoribonuclease, partial [Bryobacteraceae bacterium]|nr:YicC/YloC family endoribonuclease [Bryobacteraceae bacterium]
MPIRSMTGFARVSRATPQGELTVSIKAVNHKGLDLHLHVPSELDSAEPALRSAIRKRVSRGHVQVMVHLKGTAGVAGAAAVNEPMLRAWIDAFRDAARQYGLEGAPDLNRALCIPGMIESRGAEPTSETLNAELLDAAAEALEELDAFRV